MRIWLLIVSALLAAQAPPAAAQTAPAVVPAPTEAVPVPPARLIKPRQKVEPQKLEAKPAVRRPVDERCRALKQELEGELVRLGNTRKTFQARLAHNAGTRLCRDGQVEKGMAEFRKGLSYLDEIQHP